MHEGPFQSGVVALLGRPNAGKSTLVNFIVGQRVSIVSPKPQTTRRSVLGVARTEGYELLLVDTPGLHEPHTRLGRVMVESARQALIQADVLLVVVDVSRKPDEEDARLAAQIRTMKGDTPVLLCLNKMDQLKAEFVVDRVAAYEKLFGVEEAMLTTATRGHNVDKLVARILPLLPEGEPRFDEDDYTDQTQRFMAAEIVRSEVLNATRQEVPHATAVVVDEWTEEPGLARVAMSIVVEKAGQKAILIGKGGAFLKKVGTAARLQIEELIGRRVHLELHVKVREDWRMSPRLLKELEYDV